MHSTIETVDLGDMEKCIQLLVSFARSVGVGERFAVEI